MHRAWAGRLSMKRFVPWTHIEDGLTVLPVTLPDGETLTMRYPARMHVAAVLVSTAGSTSTGPSRVASGAAVSMR